MSRLCDLSRVGTSRAVSCGSPEPLLDRFPNIGNYGNETERYESRERNIVSSGRGQVGDRVRVKLDDGDSATGVVMYYGARARPARENE